MAERKRVTVTVKPISESKTLWLAAVTIVIGVLTWFGVVVPETVDPETVVGTILTVVGAINAVLRIWYTSQPVVTPAQQAPALGKKV